MKRNIIKLWAFDFLAVVASLVLLAETAFGGTTQFDFSGDLNATYGAGTLEYYNGATTSSVVSFGTASSFSLFANR